jgi:hypothetical protein
MDVEALIEDTMLDDAVAFLRSHGARLLHPLVHRILNILSEDENILPNCAK